MEALAGSQSSASVAAAYYGLQTGGAGTSAQVEEALAAHTRAATAYKIDPEAFTPITLALMKNFKIFGDDLGRSLAAVGQASKEGQLKVTDFALTLPQVAGQMNTYKLTGVGNANMALAALQSIRTDVGEAGQAATDFNEMMNSMYSSQGKKGFALEGKGSTGQGPGSFVGERARAMMKKALGTTGIDVFSLIEDGAKHGMTPIDAVLGRLSEIKSKLTAHEFSDLLAQMFTNDGARKGWQALLNHFEQFRALRKELDAINATKVGTDFTTASAGPEAAVRRAEEAGTQLTRRLGEGFAPLLTPLNMALQGILSLLDQLDTKLPGASNVILAITGGLLAMAAAIGAIGFVLPAITAGFGVLVGGLGLVLTPLGLVVAAIAAVSVAGYELYTHWKEVLAFFGYGPKAGPLASGAAAPGHWKNRNWRLPGAAEEAPALPQEPALNHWRGRWHALTDDKGGDTPTDGASQTDVPMPANSNVRVTLGIDGDGRIIVKDAKSDNPAVQVAAPNINPGQTMGRP